LLRSRTFDDLPGQVKIELYFAPFFPGQQARIFQIFLNNGLVDPVFFILQVEPE
jgi:hypothetical protein